MTGSSSRKRFDIRRVRSGIVQAGSPAAADAAQGQTAGAQVQAAAGMQPFYGSYSPADIYADDDEIDLLALLREFKKHIISIMLCIIVFGGAAFAFSKFIMIPQYSSQSMMYIISKETTLTSLADLQIGSQLTDDYQIIVKSRPVLQTVIDQLNLDISYEQFYNRIEIGNPNNTRILTITVEDADPQLAKDIVDSVARVSSDYIAETMEMVPPKMIEEGTVATMKSSPSVSRNTLIGALAGAVIMCAVITVKFLLNDSIATAEDVENYLGISVLASIPERKYSTKEDDYNDDDNKLSRKRKE